MKYQKHKLILIKLFLLTLELGVILFVAYTYCMTYEHLDNWVLTDTIFAILSFWTLSF